MLLPNELNIILSKNFDTGISISQIKVPKLIVFFSLELKSLAANMQKKPKQSKYFSSTQSILLFFENILIDLQILETMSLN